MIILKKIWQFIKYLFTIEKSCAHVIKNRPDLGLDHKGRSILAECLKCGTLVSMSYYVPRPLDSNSDL